MKYLCTKCGLKKDKNDFYKRKSGTPLSYCKDCQTELKQKKFEEKIEFIVELKQNLCEDCNNEYPALVFDFYKDGKIYPLYKAKNKSLNKIIEEIKDHMMLCKNCIAIREWSDD